MKRTLPCKPFSYYSFLFPSGGWSVEIVILPTGLFSSCSVQYQQWHMTYFYCLSMHFVASHSIPIRGQNVDSYKYSSVDTKPYFVTLENFSLCSLVLVFQGNLLPFWIFCYPLLFLSGGWNAEMVFPTFFFLFYSIMLL